MPLQATSGAASYDAFGGGVAVVPTYIEDVFSTYLYTGNGTTQTITNSIDLAGKGGMVWMKDRSRTTNHTLYDTVRGVNKVLYSDVTSAQDTTTASLTAFNSDGFSVSATGGYTNINGDLFASWTFRKQPKFFDVVTWTGTDGNARNISHSLGSVPGCIIFKKTSDASAWYVYHNQLNGGSSPQNWYVRLDTTTAQTNVTVMNGTLPTSTQFSVSGFLNNSTETWVAYIFAHDAGGFGLTGTDNVISCGSFTTDGSGAATVNLGYEPQWILVKPNNSANSWAIYDTMRGWTASTGGDAYLLPNTSGAEGTGDYGGPTATGFVAINGFNTNTQCIYIAIRRNPMKVPTTGTSVFQPIQYASDNTDNRLITTGIVTDAVFSRYKDAITSRGTTVGTRLTGDGFLGTTSTAAENTGANAFSTPTVGYGNGFSTMTGFGVGTNATALLNFGTIYNAIAYAFKRAPSFFDEVCYTGTGTLGQTYNHNLGVAPELMIVKNRTTGGRIWAVYSNAIGATQYLRLDDTAPQSGVENRMWNSTSPTSTVFTVGDYGDVNTSSNNYVAYLFATCAGVSKVGSYTGTGALQTVNCGFTSGARFVLIKRTDSTGDWWTYDSARGITSGNDPYLFLNSTAAEVTGTNYVDTDSTGFKVTASAPAGLNANGGTYIFLAIA